VHRARLANTLLKDEESARGNHVLACNFAKYSPIKKNFTHRLSKKPFLIWLLTTPPYLRCVATLPCKVSLLACFTDINISQGISQHLQGSVGFLVFIYLQIYQEIFQ